MATGFLLSTTLPGCADRRAVLGIDKPVPVAVPIKDTPPAELTRCPEPVQGFPTRSEAEIPPEVRSAMIRLATGFAARTAQLLRLIRWHDPKACPDAR